jgi:hypothetical protein
MKTAPVAVSVATTARMKTAPVPVFASSRFSHRPGFRLLSSCRSKNMDDPSRHHLDYQRIERDKPAYHDEMHETRLGCLNIVLAGINLFIAIFIAAGISAPPSEGTAAALALLLLAGFVSFITGVVALCVTWRHLNGPVRIVTLIGHIAFAASVVVALTA